MIVGCIIRTSNYFTRSSLADTLKVTSDITTLLRKCFVMNVVESKYIASGIFMSLVKKFIMNIYQEIEAYIAPGILAQIL